MSKIYLITLIVWITSSLSAQTLEFSGKDWKEFNKVLQKNISAAEKFYDGNIDYTNLDEENGMPTIKLPLPKITRNYIETAGYSATQIYRFDDKEKSKIFLSKLVENLKIPSAYQITEKASFMEISTKENEGMHTTIQITTEDNEVIILFSPPLDIPIPW